MEIRRFSKLMLYISGLDVFVVRLILEMHLCVPNLGLVSYKH